MIFLYVIERSGYFSMLWRDSDRFVCCEVAMIV